MPRLLRLILLGSLVGAAAFPQSFGFGVKLGHSVTDVFSSRIVNGVPYTPGSAKYTIGGTAELRLPARVSAEFDILYRPARYSAGPVERSAGQWQFPLLLKYRVRSGLVTPFAEGGISFEHFTGDAPELVDRSAKGLVLGAGLEGSLPVFRLTGEIRYTHWGATTFRVPGGAALSRQNQLELLVGASF